jgi:predicted hotdog family 3-hydroxylacyl-ACP dehydratase
MNINLLELLPQRPPMVMIDELTHCDQTSATAVKTFSKHDYGAAEEGVLEPALIECLAQTMAAAYGLIARSAGEAPAIGMLVGVSNFRFHRRAAIGKILELSTSLLKRLGPLSLIKGSIRQDGVLIAEGELKFFVGETPP